MKISMNRIENLPQTCSLKIKTIFICHHKHTCISHKIISNTEMKRLVYQNYMNVYSLQCAFIRQDTLYSKL